MVAVGAIGTSCGSVTKNSAIRTTTATATTASAVETLVKEGISQANADMLAQATTTFENVLLLSPNNVYALNNLGVIDQTDGQ